MKHQRLSLFAILTVLLTSAPAMAAEVVTGKVLYISISDDYRGVTDHGGHFGLVGVTAVDGCEKYSAREEVPIHFSNGNSMRAIVSLLHAAMLSGRDVRVHAELNTDPSKGPAGKCMVRHIELN